MVSTAIPLSIPQYFAKRYNEIESLFSWLILFSTGHEYDTPQLQGFRPSFPFQVRGFYADVLLVGQPPSGPPHRQSVMGATLDAFIHIVVSREIRPPGKSDCSGKRDVMCFPRLSAIQGFIALLDESNF
jgi:hypothetical protein